MNIKCFYLDFGFFLVWSCCKAGDSKSALCDERRSMLYVCIWLLMDLEMLFWEFLRKLKVC